MTLATLTYMLQLAEYVSFLHETNAARTTTLFIKPEFVQVNNFADQLFLRGRVDCQMYRCVRSTAEAPICQLVLVFEELSRSAGFYI